jgi:hypothetical protein
LAVHEERALAPADYFARLAGSFAEAGRSAGFIDRELAVGGRTLRLRFAGQALMPVLLPALAHLVTEAEAAEATIGLWDAQSTGVPLPSYPWQTTDWGPRGTIRGFHDERIRLHFDPGAGSLIMYDPDRSGTAIFAVASAEAIPWYERAAPLQPALHWLLSGRSLNLVHAGVVGRADRGVLIGGASGSGKSTVAVACLEAGFDYLGDDYVLISLEEEPVAFSLYATAKLDPASLAMMPWLERAVTAHDGLNDGKEKMLVPVYELRGTQIRTRAGVSAIVLPQVTGGPKSRLHPVSAADTLRALAPSTIIQMPHEARAALDTLADLARRVPSFRLELGTDLDSVPALLDTLLETA